MKSPLAVLMIVLGLTAAACGGGSDLPATTQSAQPEEEPASEAAESDAPQPDAEESEATEESNDGASSAGEKAKAKVIDTAFVPTELTVKVGTEVTWNQIGDQPHSVTAVNGEFDSSPKCSPLKSENCDFEGDTFSYTFEEPGTYDYYCRIHGLPTGRGMFATLTVEK